MSAQEPEQPQVIDDNDPWKTEAFASEYFKVILLRVLFVKFIKSEIQVKASRLNLISFN